MVEISPSCTVDLCASIEDPGRTGTGDEICMQTRLIGGSGRAAAQRAKHDFECPVQRGKTSSWSKAVVKLCYDLPSRRL